MRCVTGGSARGFAVKKAIRSKKAVLTRVYWRECSVT